jgi:hypothetical protein
MLAYQMLLSGEKVLNWGVQIAKKTFYLILLWVIQRE